jgi:ureidoacrylate peracid hydrolase
LSKSTNFFHQVFVLTDFDQSQPACQSSQGQLQRGYLNRDGREYFALAKCRGHENETEAVRTWPVFFEHFCGTPEHRARAIETFTPGNSGHSLWSELDVTQGDLILLKRRFGAFVPGSSDLHASLQERGIDTLIISGTLSQVCCESTARDAMMMNYKVFFITDACATLTDGEHGGTLSAMAHVFCDVRDTQSMLSLIAAV